MPYKSKAQRGFFNANKAKLESQGVDVNEWNQASKGKSLPAKVKPKPKAKHPAPAYMSDTMANLAAHGRMVRRAKALAKIQRGY